MTTYHTIPIAMLCAVLVRCDVLACWYIDVSPVSCDVPSVVTIRIK